MQEIENVEQGKNCVFPINDSPYRSHFFVGCDQASSTGDV